MNTVPAVAAPPLSVRKPVSPTSSAVQASSIREEGVSRHRDLKEISLFIDLRYRRSLVPCDDRSMLSALIDFAMPQASSCSSC